MSQLSQEYIVFAKMSQLLIFLQQYILMLMTGRTHEIAAFSGLVVAVASMPSAPTLSLGTLVACLFANQLGAVAPDIDQPTAPFWRNLPIGGFLGKIITKLLGGHRFLTHSIIGMILMSWVLKLLLVFITPIFPTLDMGYIWWAFMIGMLSHLVMDSLTKEGVPWLLPVPVKLGFPPAKALRVTTGEFVETYLVFPGLVLANLVFVAVNYTEVVTFLQTQIK
jgi:inner membrane protein